MISKTDILKMVRTIRKWQAGTPDHRIMHPERDWMIGLALTLVLFVVGAGYAGHEFYVYLKKADESVSVESTVIRYDQKKVNEVLDRYEERKKRFESLRNDRSNAGTLPSETTEEEVEEAAVVAGDDVATTTSEALDADE